MTYDRTTALLESHLRDTLRQAADQVEVPPGLTDRLLTGSIVAAERSAPQRDSKPLARVGRSGPLPVIAAVVVVALVTTAVVIARGSLFGSAPSAHRAKTLPVVPWSTVGRVDVTSQPPSARSAAVAAPAGTRSCSSSDFRLVWSRTTTQLGFEGWVATEYLLRSTSRSSCFVSAYGIPVVLFDTRGKLLDNDAPHASGPALAVRELLVRPGQIVTDMAGWAHVAGAGPPPSAMILLPSGLTSDSPDPSLSIALERVAPPPKPRNPANVGPWRTGWYDFGAPTISDPGALRSLAAAGVSAAPASVTAGAVVPITVEVQNHSDRAVALRPCPTVSVTLRVVPTKEAFVTGTQGPLNCSEAPGSVAPGGVVRFAAELDTSGLPTGQGEITWALLDRSGLVQVSAGVPIRIAPAS